jgi:hypothetical protein
MQKYESVFEDARASALDYALVWHEKADIEDDPFIRFTLHYFGLITLLRIYHKGLGLESGSDRDIIRSLKRNDTIKSRFYKTATEYNPNFLQRYIRIINENGLRKFEGDIDRFSHGALRIRGYNDFGSIIESSVRIRNNLFHGTKGFYIERDQNLVTNADIVVDYLFEALFSLIKENFSLGDFNWRF